jgi:hypothetical protein
LPAGHRDGRASRVPRKAILAIHPALKDAWGRHLGYSLMFKENLILVAVLEALMKRGIQAMGLHDGLLVALSKAKEAEAVMIEKAEEIVGGYIPVSIER